MRLNVHIPRVRAPIYQWYRAPLCWSKLWHKRLTGTSPAFRDRCTVFLVVCFSCTYDRREMTYPAGRLAHTAGTMPTHSPTWRRYVHTPGRLVTLCVSRNQERKKSRDVRGAVATNRTKCQPLPVQQTVTAVHLAGEVCLLYVIHIQQTVSFTWMQIANVSDIVRTSSKTTFQSSAHPQECCSLLQYMKQADCCEFRLAVDCDSNINFRERQWHPINIY